MIGIQLRERTAPLKYTIDNDYNSSSSEDDDNGVPFPKERTITHSWLPEVLYIYKLDLSVLYIFFLFFFLFFLHIFSVKYEYFFIFLFCSDKNLITKI